MCSNNGTEEPSTPAGWQWEVKLDYIDPINIALFLVILSCMCCHLLNAVIERNSVYGLRGWNWKKDYLNCLVWSLSTQKTLRGTHPGQKDHANKRVELWLLCFCEGGLKKKGVYLCITAYLNTRQDAKGTERRKESSFRPVHKHVQKFRWNQYEAVSHGMISISLVHLKWRADYVPLYSLSSCCYPLSFHWISRIRKYAKWVCQHACLYVSWTLAKTAEGPVLFPAIWIFPPTDAITLIVSECWAVLS